MAVFAHPDDESFGPGGTLARYAADGVEVFLVTATRGEMGKLHGKNPPVTETTMGSIRTKELDCACRVLGIKHKVILGYVDGELPRADHTELIGLIVRLIRQWRPHVLLTFPPDGLTGHPDHMAISQAVKFAFKRAGGTDFYSEQLKEGLKPWDPLKLYYYVVPDSLAERLGLCVYGTPDDEITTVIDISSYSSPRGSAIRCHYSQLIPREIRDHQKNEVEEQAKRLLRNQNFFLLENIRMKRTTVREWDLFEGIRLRTIPSTRDGHERDHQEEPTSAPFNRGVEN
jgi:LmbE family N-acetylglucosaminyl deacetylase